MLGPGYDHVRTRQGPGAWQYVFISKTSEGKDPDTEPINLNKVVPSSPLALKEKYDFDIY